MGGRGSCRAGHQKQRLAGRLALPPSIRVYRRSSADKILPAFICGSNSSGTSDRAPWACGFPAWRGRTEGRSTCAAYGDCAGFRASLLCTGHKSWQSARQIVSERRACELPQSNGVIRLQSLPDLVSDLGRCFFAVAQREQAVVAAGHIVFQAVEQQINHDPTQVLKLA